MYNFQFNHFYFLRLFLTKIRVRKVFKDSNIYRRKESLYVIPFLIESPELKASKIESMSLQYIFLILSSASVRSAITQITFRVNYDV